MCSKHCQTDCDPSLLISRIIARYTKDDSTALGCLNYKCLLVVGGRRHLPSTCYSAIRPRAEQTTPYRHINHPVFPPFKKRMQRPRYYNLFGTTKQKNKTRPLVPGKNTHAKLTRAPLMLKQAQATLDNDVLEDRSGRDVDGLALGGDNDDGALEGDATS
jgi:hypothetical protein